MKVENIHGFVHNNKNMVITRSRRYINVLDPEPVDIFIEDIASGLGNTCRYNGQVPFFSVAQHSIMMANSLSRQKRKWRLAVLLHDAHEAYLGDITAPVRQHISGFVELINVWNKAIYTRFGLRDWEMFADEIKAMDVKALENEWDILYGRKKRSVSLWNPEFATIVYEQELTKALNGLKT